MSPLSSVFDHLWQSTAFAAAVALATLAFRRNRARVRHSLWLAASIKFLVPFSLLIALGGHLHWPTPSTPPTLAVIVDIASQPFTVKLPITPPSHPLKPAADPIPAIALAVWLCGFLAIASAWLLRCRRLAATIRAAAPVNLALPIPARSSGTLLEPGVFGIFRPVLLLPAGIADRLTPAQLQTVLAHELLHVQRRDNLSAAIQMFIETLFWFHPLVWWIGRRLLAERERACDEGVLHSGNDPRVYAEAVLNVCKLYVESPLPCVSGITGANLKRRIEEIMRQPIVRDLSAARKLVLAFAAGASLVLPIAIGLLHSPIAQAQSPAPPPRPALVPTPVAAPVPQVAARPVPAPTPTPATAPIPQQSDTPPDFTNHDMARVYARYGRPDSTRVAGAATDRPIVVWRYMYLDDFRSATEFQFPAADRAGMTITGPVALILAQGLPDAGAGVSVLASQLARELHTSDPLTPGLPGRRSLISTYPTALTHPNQYVILTIPLDSFSGAVDIIARIQSTAENQIVTTAAVRDHLTVPATTDPAYQPHFLLQPGPYICQFVAREAATGHTYGESITFEVK